MNEEVNFFASLIKVKENILKYTIFRMGREITTDTEENRRIIRKYTQV